MFKIMIVLGSKSDFPVTESGLNTLRELGIPFTLHVASAHRSPDYLHKLIHDFEAQGGSLYICVAGKSAHLAGVVAAATSRPVIAVPVFSQPTAGFDSLLSMSQMPSGVPVATMGFGNTGFTNGCILAAQMLALADGTLYKTLQDQRRKQAELVAADDKAAMIEFKG